MSVLKKSAWRCTNCKDNSVETTQALKQAWGQESYEQIEAKRQKAMDTYTPLFELKFNVQETKKAFKETQEDIKEIKQKFDSIKELTVTLTALNFQLEKLPKTIEDLRSQEKDIQIENLQCRLNADEQHL